MEGETKKERAGQFMHTRPNADAKGVTGEGFTTNQSTSHTSLAFPRYYIINNYSY
jgi:hypothetical protein